jgi:FkbM family methyltransferase
MSEVITTDFGRFLIDPGECVGSTLKAGTLWDGPGFLQVIAKEHARFGEEGISVLDVGAHIGSFTIWCASQGAWRVVAVEPVPSTVLQLKANLDLNKPTCADRVVVIETAAYSERAALAPKWLDPRNSGGTPLVKAPGNMADGWIPAVPLDEYRFLCGRRVSLIKIDAQGCDGAALQGLEQTIIQHQPVIVFEWEEDLAAAHPQTLHHTLSWFVGMQYQVHPWPSQPNNYLAIPARVWRQPS